MWYQQAATQSSIWSSSSHHYMNIILLKLNNSMELIKLDTLKTMKILWVN